MRKITKKIQEIENPKILEEIQEIEDCKDHSNIMYNTIRKSSRNKPEDDTETGTTTIENESMKS